MRCILFPLVAYLLGLASVVSGQISSVSGRVVDGSDQHPLMDVAVIFGDGKGALTDADGRFAINNLEAGTYTLRFRFMGFDERQINGVLQPGQSFDLGDIPMNPAANQLDEIRVSSATASYTANYAGSNTYLSPRLVRESRSMGTEELLRQVPGLNVIGDMGLSNRPNLSIRGSWGRRSYKVLLLEDGSYIAPAPYLGPGAYYNPPIERIEAIRVIKGAETLLYGPNNMYGVVNYISRRPPAEPEVMLKLSGGQRGYATAQAAYGGTWNQLGADVQVLYKRFDGFIDNSGVEIFNLHTKFYVELDKKQSFYFKLGYQQEVNNASLSAQTPFTFETDPEQNPFDADEFRSRRYSLDVIHKYAANEGWSFTTKVYGADFARDWWKQKVALVRVDEARAYLGESIYMDRYRYLDELSTGPDDYVRVGQVINGREATTDSKWNYTFAGMQEQVEKNWNYGIWNAELLAGGRIHQEIYLDQLLQNDSSRWARSGKYTTDLRYDLLAAALWAKYSLSTGRFKFTPLLRFEHVNMVRKDLLATSRQPVQNPDNQPEFRNRYDVLLPGLAMNIRIGHLEIAEGVRNEGSFFTSIYRGFIAPNDQFAFLVQENGVVSAPQPGQELNMKPETSLNLEAGLRGSLANQAISGQLTGFHNRISNFYAAGRGEIFQSLGQVVISGAEAGLDFDLTRLAGESRHQIGLSFNATFLRSRILSGELRDRELATAVTHSAASAQELVNMINTQNGVTAYTLDGFGQEVPLSAPVSASDLENISAIAFRFGTDGIAGYDAPYTPPFSIHSRLSYRYLGFLAALEYHYLAAQYAEYANFETESADGSIGKLPGYGTVDAQVNYQLNREKLSWEFFIAGKNISNVIYRASRLNRVASGIFPGGFRQVNAGLGLTF